MSRSQARTAETVMAVVVLLTAVMLGASADRSWELEERDFGGWAIWNVQHEPPEPPHRGERSGDFDELGTPADPVDWSWLGAVGRAFLAVAALVIIYGMWTWIRARLVLRRHVQATPAPAVATETRPDLPVLRRGVREARRYLQEITDPTDAVIAAWLSLEEAAESSGVHRRASQTPTEFTVAVLERTAADPSATTELLALYHRARFSGAAVTGQDVTTALHAFGRVAASWNALTAAPSTETTAGTRPDGTSAAGSR